MIVANSVATSLRTRNDSTGEQKEFFIHLMVIQKTIINLMFWVSYIVKYSQQRVDSSTFPNWLCWEHYMYLIVKNNLPNRRFVFTSQLISLPMSYMYFVEAELYVYS